MLFWSCSHRLGSPLTEVLLLLLLLILLPQIAAALPQRTAKSVWAAGTRMFHPGNYQVGEGAVAGGGINAYARVQPSRCPPLHAPRCTKPLCPALWWCCSGCCCRASGAPQRTESCCAWCRSGGGAGRRLVACLGACRRVAATDSSQFGECVGVWARRGWLAGTHRPCSGECMAALESMRSPSFWTHART